MHTPPPKLYEIISAILILMQPLLWIYILVLYGQSVWAVKKFMLSLKENQTAPDFMAMDRENMDVLLETAPKNVKNVFLQIAKIRFRRYVALFCIYFTMSVSYGIDYCLIKGERSDYWMCFLFAFISAFMMQRILTSAKTLRFLKNVAGTFFGSPPE